MGEIQQGKEDSKALLSQAFKQFSLETERLEMAYRCLEEQFKGVQRTLQDSQVRLSGKLIELECITGYLEAILNHISQGILFIDHNGIVTTCNQAAEEILGIPAKELLFYPFTQKFEDQFLGFSLGEALKNKVCPRMTFISWVKKDKEKVEIEVEPAFVETENKAYPVNLQSSAVPIQGLLIVLRNMTEIRRLQQQASRHDRLQEIGEMAAHLAHEIRNPLGGIRGFASLLQQELKDKPDLQKMASQIVEGTDHLNSFVTGILHYTRPFELHLETVDLVHFIEELRIWMLADSAWNKQTDFVIRSSLKELPLSIDTQLFKSALLNLFVNAIQAMPNGGTLTVAIECDKENVKIKIEDTGVGIPPENKDKIFSLFFTTKETGTGLGLSEVHKVIQAHQGTIEVNSDVGRGTTFTLKLPLNT